MAPAVAPFFWQSILAGKRPELSQMDAELIQLIHKVGVRKVAQALQISREATMSLAIGIAHDGTKAQAAPHRAKLADLKK